VRKLLFYPFPFLWGDPEFEVFVKRKQEEKAAIRAQIRELEKRGEIAL